MCGGLAHDAAKLEHSAGLLVQDGMRSLLLFWKHSHRLLDQGDLSGVDSGL
jgi:hypothetical protein